MRSRDCLAEILSGVMKDAAHILLVGNDGRLLQERTELLAHFWSIAAMSTFDEGPVHLRLADLLVLCHSVAPEQQAAWIASSRADRPGRPIVSIAFASASGPGEAPGHGRSTDAVVGHDRGPAALVSAIYELLTERGLLSKPWASGRQTLLNADGLPVATR